MSNDVARQNAIIEPGAVAVVGAGSIGVAWTIVFITAGYRVHLHDTDEIRLIAARSEVAARFEDLRAANLIRTRPQELLEHLTCHRDLSRAIEGAGYVQECAPEDAELKQCLFAELDGLAAADVVLASSSSFLPASQFASELSGRHRVLVVHPANPPYLLRVAEVVPAPFTSQATIARTLEFVRSANIAPVELNREVEGFVFNRLQGALLREAYCLVRDKVVTPAEIDLLVRDGLGLRWSVIGPFETAHLNTRGGIRAHAQRMGPAYLRMGQQRGQDDPWTPAMVATVAEDLEARRPLSDWGIAVEKRDRALMSLLALRRGGQKSDVDES
jgi:3-hydroxyacyl-CoA dehydrogenase